ncbi:heterodisulfide reductase-related iron-sulfur binding cluster [Ilyobacter sp.]|uniref:heterodisulfide reductase-related iron-sulfur binding cluster n=1 Tax=Ilyobacter sp. TaxID=3100343 RepID=UPI003566773C
MNAKTAIKMHQYLGFSKIFNTANPAPEGNKNKYVFFPGCSLPSYNPKAVGKILDHLQDRLGMEVGSMLKCCGKPTLRMESGSKIKCCGKQTQNIKSGDKFIDRFSQVEKELDNIGAETIIVTCQSCLEIFERYGNKKVISLWELLPEIGLPDDKVGVGDGSDVIFNIHDPCSGRDKENVHEGIRWIIKELGYSIEELKNSREKTICCGLSGLPVHGDYDISKKIMKKRAEESTTGHMISYCAACRESMETGGVDSLHILDLVFGDTYKKEKVGSRNIGVLKQWDNRFKSKMEFDKRK